MSDIKGTITLKGRLFLNFEIEALTGLHIGGAFEGVQIGGVDKTVIRDPLTNRPYIPGSSLRGKVRSLVEKYTGKKQNQRINLGYIHSCQDNDWETYPNCDVCQVFGLPGEREFGTPARLVVRDLRLKDEIARALDKAKTDLPYTEVKVEVAIDRVTSQANPRQLERVPAGAVFDGGEMVYSLYAGDFTFKHKDQDRSASMDPRRDLDHFEAVLMGLQLLEDDYLGGSGARGYGRMQLRNIRLSLKNGSPYPAKGDPLGKQPYDSLAELRAAWDKDLKAQVLSRL